MMIYNLEDHAVLLIFSLKVVIVGIALLSQTIGIINNTFGYPKRKISNKYQDTVAHKLIAIFIKRFQHLSLIVFNQDLKIRSNIL